MLAEISIIMGAAAVVYVIHHLAFGMIMQDGPPDRAETLSLWVVTVFAISYIAFRLGGVLLKAKGSGRDRSLKAAVATTVLAGLVLIAVAYPHSVDPEQPSEVNLILRSEIAGDIWVIETKKADDVWPVEVGRDTVYLASATIVGLATFGSLVTIRILGTPKTREARKWGAVMMFSGVVGVIGYQSFLMYIACCSSINASQFAGFLWLTVGVLVSIALGSGLIMDSWFKDEENSPKI